MDTISWGVAEVFVACLDIITLGQSFHPPSVFYSSNVAHLKELHSFSIVDF